MNLHKPQMTPHRMALHILLVFVIATSYTHFPLKAQQRFTSVDVFWDYVTAQSIHLKKNEIDLTQAQKSKWLTWLEVAEPVGNTNFSFKNNTQLPVTLVPAQLLGGENGRFEPIKFGLQYETQLAFSGEFKLLNPSAWLNFKRLKEHIRHLETRQQLSKRELFMQVIEIYYQIITLQAQQNTASYNLKIADTLYQYVNLRFEKGLATQQDLNESKANQLQTLDTEAQLAFLLAQQYAALKILCDIPAQDEIKIVETIDEWTDKPMPEVRASDLYVKEATLQQQLAWIDWHKQKLIHLPSLTLFYSTGQQQFNTQPILFDNQTSWLPSSFIGLRLSFSLPSAQQISLRFSAKYAYQKAQLQANQSTIQAENEAEKLKQAYQYALSKKIIDEDIHRLKQENYQKNLLAYQTGTLSLQQTLISFQDMLEAAYALQASRIEIYTTYKKIIVHNQF